MCLFTCTYWMNDIFHCLFFNVQWAAIFSCDFIVEIIWLHHCWCAVVSGKNIGMSWAESVSRSERPKWSPSHEWSFVSNSRGSVKLVDDAQSELVSTCPPKIKKIQDCGWTRVVSWHGIWTYEDLVSKCLWLLHVQPLRHVIHASVCVCVGGGTCISGRISLIILVKGLSKQSLSAYFSDMKIDLKYVFLHAYHLFSKICDHGQKHTIPPPPF